MSHPTWRLRLPASSRVPRYTAFVASILLGNYDPVAYTKQRCDNRRSVGGTRIEYINLLRGNLIMRKCEYNRHSTGCAILKVSPS